MFRSGEVRAAGAGGLTPGRRRWLQEPTTSGMQSQHINGVLTSPGHLLTPPLKGLPKSRSEASGGALT